MFLMLTIIFLGICTMTDLLRKQIWWPLSLIFIAVAVALHFIQGDKEIWEILAGLFLGVGLLFISWATKEALGYGDGMVVAACGAALGFVTVLHLFLLALMFAAVWSGILLVFRKAGRKDSFPFVPFLLLAQICIVIQG